MVLFILSEEFRFKNISLANCIFTRRAVCSHKINKMKLTQGQFSRLFTLFKIILVPTVGRKGKTEKLEKTEEKERWYNKRLLWNLHYFVTM